jgi:hypothetical protein
MRHSSSLVTTLILIAALSGCSSHHSTTREVVYDRHTGEPVRVERHTTTTDTTADDTGVVSGTFNVIGEVISLPFRAVGGLVRAIF